MTHTDYFGIGAGIAFGAIGLSALIMGIAMAFHIVRNSKPIE